MIFNKNLALQTAKHLLQINAIKLNLENPFTWASGWKSPIYCDNRIILSYPKIRSHLSDIISKKIAQEHSDPLIIAGVATGAIGISMLVADKLKLPFIYVRPEPKKHGQKNQIEGHLNSKLPVLVIEDLISTGNSSLEACQSLISENLKIKGLISIFNYNFEISKLNFESKNISYSSLCSYNYLIDYAVKNNYVSDVELTQLIKWRNNPQEWNK